MNIEETIFPRRNIYVGGVLHTPPAYTQNEHWLLRSLVENFGEFLFWTLTKCFLAPMDLIQKSLLPGKANKFLCSQLLVLLLPIDSAKIIQTSKKSSSMLEFFISNAVYLRDLSKYTHFSATNTLFRNIFLQL